MYILLFLVHPMRNGTFEMKDKFGLTDSKKCLLSIKSCMPYTHIFTVQMRLVFFTWRNLKRLQIRVLILSNILEIQSTCDSIWGLLYHVQWNTIVYSLCSRTTQRRRNGVSFTFTQMLFPDSHFEKEPELSIQSASLSSGLSFLRFKRFWALCQVRHCLAD